MPHTTWVSHWCDGSLKEMIEYPELFCVHPDFLHDCDADDARGAFRTLHATLCELYAACVADPARMKLPLHEKENFPYLSKQERVSRGERYYFADLLCAVGLSGEAREDGLVILPDALAAACKQLNLRRVKDTFGLLANFGFAIEGLRDGKIPVTESVIVYFPDNPHLCALLCLLARKAVRLNRLTDFRRMHYKLLKDDLSTADYGNGIDHVCDILPGGERACAQEINARLTGLGYYLRLGAWNEGPQVYYHRTEASAKRKGPHNYVISSYYGELRLSFNIRKDKIDGCLDQIAALPDDTRRIFLESDKGCKNKPICVSGLGYILDGQAVWRCGCCGPKFQCAPSANDVDRIISIVEKGN